MYQIRLFLFKISTLYTSLCLCYQVVTTHHQQNYLLVFSYRGRWQHLTAAVNTCAKLGTAVTTFVKKKGSVSSNAQFIKPSFGENFQAYADKPWFNSGHRLESQKGMFVGLVPRQGTCRMSLRSCDVYEWTSGRVVSENCIQRKKFSDFSIENCYGLCVTAYSNEQVDSTQFKSKHVLQRNEQDRQSTYNVTPRCVRGTVCCSEKQ
jgi:hypothetical protein